MKLLKYILFTFLVSQCFALANYNDIYIADIQYDWINKTEVEKEAIISEVHDIIFENAVGVPAPEKSKSSEYTGKTI